MDDKLRWRKRLACAYRACACGFVSFGLIAHYTQIMHIKVRSGLKNSSGWSVIYCPAGAGGGG